MDVEEAKEGEAKEGGEAPKVAKKKKAPEPTSFALSNPSRVTPEQEKFVSFNESRYTPVNPRSKATGIVILVDHTPEVPEEVVKVELPGLDSDKDEAKPPEPFEWSPDMQR